MYKNYSLREAQLEELILWQSVAIVIALLQFPYQKIDGNPVPTIIFDNRSSFFHPFILALNFSFFGSFSTIFLRKRYPRIASYFLLLALLSVTVQVCILTWLIAPMCLRLLQRLYVYVIC